MSAKDIKFGSDARAKMLKGVETLKTVSRWRKKWN